MDAGVAAAPAWFVFDGRHRQGPMSAGALTAALQRLPDPGRALVWRDGLTDWREAASLPELWPSPPPIARSPVLPIPPPAEASASPEAAASDGSVAELEKTTTLYRQLVLVVGALISVGLLRAFFTALMPPVLDILVHAGAGAVATALFIFLSITAYQLARRIDARPPAIWAIALWIPLVNLIVLYMLSQRAQAWCAVHGIDVGLLGPTTRALDARPTADAEIRPRRQLLT